MLKMEREFISIDLTNGFMMASGKMIRKTEKEYKDI
jgi:hypothetical protein